MSLTNKTYFERKWRDLPRLAEAVGHLSKERNERLNSIERSSAGAIADAIDIAELVVQHSRQIRKVVDENALEADEFHQELDALEHTLKDIAESFSDMAVEVRNCHRELK